jgi:hypothetical protein
MRTDRLARRSIDEDIEPSSDDSGIKTKSPQFELRIFVFIEHRKQFENHRKQHYNEFEIVRLRKKEIEDELRALEQDETSNQSDGKGIDT